MTVGLDLRKLAPRVDRPAYLPFALTIEQETCEGLGAPLPYSRPDERFRSARLVEYRHIELTGLILSHIGDIDRATAIISIEAQRH